MKQGAQALNDVRLLVIILALLVGGGWQQSQAANTWLTGAEFQRQLDRPISLVWQEQPLRMSLAELMQAQRVCIFLDRRIDPDQQVPLQVRDEPLEAAIYGLARQLGMSSCTIGNVIYIGPEHVTTRLPTLVALHHDRTRELPSDLQQRLLRQAAAHWSMLTTPRELIEQLASELDVTVVDWQQLPHDLWPEVDLPPLTAVERLTLILAGFDLTYDVSAAEKTLRLVAIPRELALTRTYAIPGRAEQFLDRIQRLVPQAKLERRGPQLLVTGTLEQHEAVARLLRGGGLPRSARPRGSLEKRYDLNVQRETAGDILEAVASQLGLTLEIHSRARPALARVISFRVQGATEEELLDQLLSRVELDWQLSGQTLSVVPAESKEEE